MRLINKRNESGGYYIGRGSPLGNPYDFTGSTHEAVKFRVSTREEAIIGFSKHLDECLNSGDPVVCDAFRELQIKKFKGEEIVLSCYCDPLPCHGRIILNKLEKSNYCINWFSNMRKLDHPLFYQGLKFNSVENFYQAMKAGKEDVDTRRKIAAASPFDSKKLGKEIDIRADWVNIKDDVMMFALRHKFAKGTSWRNKLDQCKCPIVEYNNWNDRYWGVDIYSGIGENKLGKMIEKIRHEQL